MNRVIFYAISLIVIFFALMRPYNNWDMIGYVASSESYMVSDQEVVHKSTYNLLKSYVSSNSFEVLTQSDSYRNAIYSSAELLDQQLPYYQIRVIYIQLINILSIFNMDKYYATHFISALSALLSLFIIYKIVFVNLKAPKIFSILPLVIAPLGVVQVARYSTPDALAFLISTAIFSLFLAKRHFWVLTMLPFLVLVRTDLIILCLSLALYYFAFDRKLFKPYVASFATCLLIYFSVNVYFGNYGWQTIFYVTLIERIANPAELTLSVSLHQYFVALEKGIYKAFESTSFVVYALSTLSILIYHIKYKFFYAVLSSPNSYLLESIHYINLAFFTLHFILFPVAWDRFFVTQYVFTLLLFLMLVYKFSKSKDADSLIAAGF